MHVCDGDAWSEKGEHLGPPQFPLNPTRPTFCTQGFSPSVSIRGLLWGATPSARARRRASSCPASSAPESAGARRRRCCRVAALGVAVVAVVVVGLVGLVLVGGERKWRTRSARSRSWRRSLSVRGVGFGGVWYRSDVGGRASQSVGPASQPVSTHRSKMSSSTRWKCASASWRARPLRTCTLARQVGSR